MGRQNILFNKKNWDNWISMCQRMKLVTLLLWYIKINSKWIIGLNARIKNYETFRIKERNNIFSIGLDKAFLDTTFHILNQNMLKPE